VNVKGVKITEQQLAAARAAMSGAFRMVDVTHALVRAGVPNFHYTADRAADRLLQLERRAGRIKVNPDNKREWIAL